MQPEKIRCITNLISDNEPRDNRLWPTERRSESSPRPTCHVSQEAFHADFTVYSKSLESTGNNACHLSALAADFSNRRGSIDERYRAMEGLRRGLLAEGTIAVKSWSGKQTQWSQKTWAHRRARPAISGSDLSVHTNLRNSDSPSSISVQRTGSWNVLPKETEILPGRWYVPGLSQRTFLRQSLVLRTNCEW